MYWLSWEENNDASPFWQEIAGEKGIGQEPLLPYILSMPQPNIVVLDGHTLNPGDLSWDAIAAQGQLTVHDRTPPEQVVERAAEAEVIFTNKSL